MKDASNVEDAILVSGAIIIEDARLAEYSSLVSDHPRLRPDTLEIVKNYKCGNCLQMCDICKQRKSARHFAASIWHHRFNQNRRLLCLECCRPKCTSRQCKTCKVCRFEICKDAKCTKRIQPLHPTLLPKDLEHLLSLALFLFLFLFLFSVLFFVF